MFIGTISLWWIESAVAEVPQNATAFWHRDKPLMVSFEANWEDSAAVVDSIDRPVVPLGHSVGGFCTLKAPLRTDNIATLVLYEPLVPVEAGELVSSEPLGQVETHRGIR